MIKLTRHRLCRFRHNGLYTASAGESHTMQLPLLSKGAAIYFYVITPNDAKNDVSTYLTQAAGDGTGTAAATTYTFPTGVSGAYTFYATIHYTDGTSESPHPSYTVSVSLPSESTPSTPVNSAPSSPGLHLQSGAATVKIDGVDILSTMPGEQVTLDLVMPSDKGYNEIYLYLADSQGVNVQFGNPSGDPVRPPLRHLSRRWR